VRLPVNAIPSSWVNIYCAFPSPRAPRVGEKFLVIDSSRRINLYHEHFLSRHIGSEFCGLHDLVGEAQCRY
jgi:hypothetical protein